MVWGEVGQGGDSNKPMGEGLKPGKRVCLGFAGPTTAPEYSILGPFLSPKAITLVESATRTGVGRLCRIKQVTNPRERV